MSRACPLLTSARRARRTRVAAFTLAEVLATIVLIGIVMPVVMRGISVALFAAEHARGTAQAASLGETKLSELAITGELGMSGGSGGDFGPEWPQYRWACMSTSRDFGLSELVLQVTWTERGAEQSLTLATLMYENALGTEEVLP